VTKRAARQQPQAASDAELERLRAEVVALRKLVGLQDGIIQRGAARLDEHEPRLAALEQERTRPEPTRHVSAAAAAQVLGCDARTIRRWIVQGRLLGRSIRLSGSSRRRWLVNANALERMASGR
jgi:hypothetical protein